MLKANYITPAFDFKWKYENLAAVAKIRKPSHFTMEMVLLIYLSLCLATLPFPFANHAGTLHGSVKGLRRQNKMFDLNRLQMASLEYSKLFSWILNMPRPFWNYVVFLRYGISSFLAFLSILSSLIWLLFLGISLFLITATPKKDNSR